MKKLVGSIYTGRRGRDPFDPTLWSSISSFFFKELARRDALHRVFGVEPPRLQRWVHLARNIHPDRTTWRQRFLIDRSYRATLTKEAGRTLRPGDLDHDFLQIGAMYDLPKVLDGRADCFSYHDGNLAESIRSPYASRGLGAREIDRGLAYERQVYHGMKTIFSMSEHLRRSFINDFGVPAERVITIGGGINLESIPELVADRRCDSQEVLFIGIDFRRKGGPELLQAFREVRERLPAAQLHIVGPRRLDLQPGRDGGVVFHGFLNKKKASDHRKLCELFRRCSLFTLPSLYEPFGIAPLEAMANQLPCLVSNRWALNEMVVPGETGDVAEPGCVDELQAKLVALLSDPDALRRMGTTARQRVLDYYTWDRVVDRLLAAVSNQAAAA